jgi:hypothetical protein
MDTGTEPQKTTAAEGKRPAKLAVMKSAKRKGVARRASGKKRAGPVVAIRKPRLTTIHQDDLEFMILLRKRSLDAQGELEKEETRLRAALEDGAEVEPGVHTARLAVTVVIE